MVLGSCSSEYHWVKVKSADPKFIVKQDALPTSYPVIPLLSTSISSPISSSFSSTFASRSERPKDHGYISTESREALLKSQEIVQSFSEQRKQDLASKDLTIRNRAIRSTLHEQLGGLPAFAKLSSDQQNRLESSLEKHLERRIDKSLKTANQPVSGTQNQISSKVTHHSTLMNNHYGRYGRVSLNPLLVLGLIILLGSLLFVSTGSIYAVIGILFAVLLIVLGLFS